MDNTYQVRGIPATYIEHFWHFGVPYIKRALDHTYGEITHEDLKGMCLERDAQLWLAYKEGKIIGAGVTQIVIYPQMKVCRIITLAGTEFDGWKHVADQMITMWAREQGCDALEALTRKGFVPKLQEMDFKYKYAVLHKRIKE